MTFSEFLAETMRVRPTLLQWVEPRRAAKGIGFVVFFESDILMHSDIMEIPLGFCSLNEFEGIVLKAGGNLDDPKWRTTVEAVRGSDDIQVYIIRDLTDPEGHRFPIRLPMPLN